MTFIEKIISFMPSRRIRCAIFAASTFILANPLYALETSRTLQDPKEEIRKTWQDRVEVISLGKDRLGLNELSNLDEVLKKYGIRNAPEVAILLLKEIDQREAELTPEERGSLADAAVDFAPDIAFIHFEAARIHLSFKNFDLKKGYASLSNAIRLSFNDLDSRHRFFINLAFWITVALVITCAVFFSIISVKYYGLLIHLMDHLLPPIFSRLSITLIILSSLVAVFFTAGPLPLLLLISLYLWLFSARSEKAVIVSVSLLICAMPYILNLSVWPAKYQTSVERTLLKADISSDLIGNLEDLNLLLKKSSEDPDIKFALALVSKSLGNYTRAAELLEQVRQAKPNWAKVYVNIGTIKYINGQYDEAISSYTKASTLDPSNFLAKYNLGKLYFKRARFDEANNELKNAEALDPKSFQYFERISNPRLSTRFVFDERLTENDLAPRLKALKKPDPARRDMLWRRASISAFTPSATALCGVIVLALFVVLAKSSRAISPAKRCPSCGRAHCKRCTKTPDKKNLCSQCYYIFVMKDQIDAAARAKKQAEEARFAKINRILRIAPSMFLPGSGHIFAGHGLAGTLALFLFLFLASLAVVPEGLTYDAYSGAIASSAFMQLSAAILALAIYSLTTFMIWRTK